MRLADWVLENKVTYAAGVDEGEVDLAGYNHLLLVIPYRFGGRTLRYIPDFVVDLNEGRHLLLESKGREDAKAKARPIRPARGANCGCLKTERSRRTLGLPAAAVQALRAWSATVRAGTRAVRCARRRRTSPRGPAVPDPGLGAGAAAATPPGSASGPSSHPRQRHPEEARALRLAHVHLDGDPEARPPVPSVRDVPRARLRARGVYPCRCARSAIGLHLWTRPQYCAGPAAGSRGCRARSAIMLGLRHGAGRRASADPAQQAQHDVGEPSRSQRGRSPRC